ncbi:Tetratricopeptide repeat protein [Candidatus Gugararchaeum adminiculabundum]|nr:Tetratricopeptide repeat protein [Candidatus Gugararchaeum adminiculabundum]
MIMAETQKKAEKTNFEEMIAKKAFVEFQPMSGGPKMIGYVVGRDADKKLIVKIKEHNKLLRLFKKTKHEYRVEDKLVRPLGAPVEEKPKQETPKAPEEKPKQPVAGKQWTNPEKLILGAYALAVKNLSDGEKSAFCRFVAKTQETGDNRGALEKLYVGWQAAVSAKVQGGGKKFPDFSNAWIAFTKTSEYATMKKKISAKWFGQGMVYAKKGDYDHAIREFDKVLSLYPNHAITIYSKAVALYKKGDYKKANELLAKAKKLDPAKFGDKAFTNSGLQKAPPMDSTEMERPETKGERFYNYGRYLESQGRYKDAVKNYQKAAKSGEPEIAKKATKAASDLEKKLNAPVTPRQLLEQGHKYENEGAYGVAMDKYRLAAKSGDPEIAKKATKAASDLDKLMHANVKPRGAPMRMDATAWYSRARLEYKAGHYQKAKEAYDQVIKLDKNNEFSNARSERAAIIREMSKQK